jgi:hypothetical protein
MADEHRTWKRQWACWRAHHEAWKRSDLNQRQYCEFHGLRQKAFENWRQKFGAEPQPAARKLLYRRGGLSHTLSHSLSHPFDHILSHGTYPSSLPPAPIVPPAREGHRRFSDVEKHRIIEEAAQPPMGDRLLAHHHCQAAKLNDVEPFAYSGTCWNRLSDNHPMSRIDDLLPWLWRPTVAVAA